MSRNENTPKPSFSIDRLLQSDDNIEEDVQMEEESLNENSRLTTRFCHQHNRQHNQSTKPHRRRSTFSALQVGFFHNILIYIQAPISLGPRIRKRILQASIFVG